MLSSANYTCLVSLIQSCIEIHAYSVKFSNWIGVQALKGGMREKVQLATKFGIVAHDGKELEVRGDPAYVRASCEASLKRLDIDCIDLYYQHRIDTRVPIEATV